MKLQKKPRGNLDSPSGSGASHLERPTLVMPAVENFGDRTCAIDAFMSTIKMFQWPCFQAGRSRQVRLPAPGLYNDNLNRDLLNTTA